MEIWGVDVTVCDHKTFSQRREGSGNGGFPCAAFATQHG
jgi:hypothetical protein